MFRVANIVMVGALLITAAVVYQLKYASTAEAERLATLRSQIRKERDAIALLKAEWARRTSPIYIQGLVERHLDMKRLDVDAFSNLDDLPPKPTSSSDGIGGMIEALVDEPLVTAAVSRPSTVPGGAAGSVPAASALRPAPRPASAAPPRPSPPRLAPAAAPYAPPYAAPAAPSGPADTLAPLLPPGSLPGAN